MSIIIVLLQIMAMKCELQVILLQNWLGNTNVDKCLMYTGIYNHKGDFTNNIYVSVLFLSLSDKWTNGVSNMPQITRVTREQIGKEPTNL